MTVNTIKQPAASIYSAILAGYTAVLILQSLLLIGNQSLDSLKINLLMQMILVILFAVWSYITSNKYLNAPLILIIAIYIWHSPFLTGHYFELAKSFAFTGRHFNYGEEFIPRATGLVALCLSAAVIGTLLGYRQKSLINEPSDVVARQGTYRLPLNLAAKRMLWAIFIGYGAITFCYLFLEGVNTFSGDYMSLYTDVNDTFISRLFHSIKYYNCIILMAVFAFNTSRYDNVFAFIFTIIIIFIQFLLGTRSIPFINLITLVVCVDYFIKRLPVIIYPAGAFFMSVVSFFMSYSRGEGLGFNVFNFASTEKEIDFLYFFWELGGVIRNVIRTMAFMGQEGFAYGKTFVYSIIYLLPKFYLEGLGFEPDYVRPSDWLAEHSADVPYGGGIGYSLVAESYYNFGFVGCIIFFLIGWFVANKYYNYIKNGDRFSLLHAMNIVIILTLHMRNDSISYMRNIVFGALFVELLRWLDRRNRIIQ